MIIFPLAFDGFWAEERKHIEQSEENVCRTSRQTAASKILLMNLTSLIMKFRLDLWKIMRESCNKIFCCMCHVGCKTRQSNFSHLASSELRRHIPFPVQLAQSLGINALLTDTRTQNNDLFIIDIEAGVEWKFTSTDTENPMHKLLTARCADQFLSFWLCSADIGSDALTASFLHLAADLKIVWGKFCN